MYTTQFTPKIEFISTEFGTWGRRDAVHLVLVVLGDREACGILGNGLLADHGEHAPHEAALVAAKVEDSGPRDHHVGGGIATGTRI